MSDSQTLWPGEVLTRDKFYGALDDQVGSVPAAGNVTATGTPVSRTLQDIAADTAVFNQLVSGLDNTGVINMSAKIKEAHDLAKTAGFRFCYVPRGTYLATDLMNGVADVIFVGPGIFKNSYRCHVIPEHARPFVYANGVNPSWHLRRFLQAVAAGSAVVVLVGDSTTQGLDQERLIRQKLRATFGGAADHITVYNMGLGGASWDDYACANFAATLLGIGNLPSWWTNPNASWPSHVGAVNPDLIIFNFGQNGTLLNDPFLNAADFYNSLNSTQALCAARFGLQPDWIFQTPYCPSNMKGSGMSPENQGRRLGAAGLTRSFVLSGCSGLTVPRPSGAGLMDVGQLASAIRDGRDPRNDAIRRYDAYDNLVITFPYVFPVRTEAFKTIFSTSNIKTQFFDHGGLSISLSSQAGNICLIEREDDSHAAVTIFAQTGVVARPRTIVAHTNPVGGGNVNVILKDNWLTVSVGSNVFINDYVVRYGDEYVPVISAVDLQPMTSTVTYLLTTMHVLYQRSMTDYQQFGPSAEQLGVGQGYPDPDAAGGFNHQSTEGSEMVLKPVIRASLFA